MTDTKKTYPKKWTDEEEGKLLKLVKEGKTPEERAQALDRSIGGQAIRLSMIAVRLSNVEMKSPDEVKKLTGLSQEELDKQLDFAKKKLNKKVKLPETPINDDDKEANVANVKALVAKLYNAVKKL